MNYMLFDESDGLVVKISFSELESYNGYLVCQTDMYNEGDEHIFNLHVLEVTEGIAVQIHAMRNNPEYIPVIKMYHQQLFKNLELEKKIERLEEQNERLDIIDGAIIDIGERIGEGGE